MQSQENLQITPDSGNTFNFISEDKATTEKRTKPQELYLGSNCFSVGSTSLLVQSHSIVKAVIVCNGFNYLVSDVKLIRQSKSEVGIWRFEEYTGFSLSEQTDIYAVVLIVPSTERKALIASLFFDVTMTTQSDFYNILLSYHAMPFLVDVTEEKMIKGLPYCQMFAMEQIKAGAPITLKI